MSQVLYDEELMNRNQVSSERNWLVIFTISNYLGNLGKWRLFRVILIIQRKYKEVIQSFRSEKTTLLVAFATGYCGKKWLCCKGDIPPTIKPICKYWFCETPHFGLLHDEYASHNVSCSILWGMWWWAACEFTDKILTNSSLCESNLILSVDLIKTKTKIKICNHSSLFS